MKYLLLYIELEEMPLSDPAVIPVGILKEGYNLTQVIPGEEPARLTEDFDSQEVKFIFAGCGYAVPCDGDTYATAMHSGTRLVLCFTDGIFE